MKTMRKIDEIGQQFKITIDNGHTSVSAPLPDDFGFTVGSEYSTPFDLGTMSGLMMKSMAMGGVSAPVGLRMRKFYTNPEPVEISFKMAFEAYYDARTEVVRPVVSLVTMGLGSELDSEGIGNKLDVFGETTREYIGVGTDSETLTPEQKGMSDKVLGLIKIVNAPSVCSISFGNVYTMDKVYITSTAVTFSNDLDSEGLPMSAEVNVTCTLQTAPIADDIISYFGGN